MSMADAGKVATPELDKQSELLESGAPAAVQDFLDWLDTQGLHICEMQTTTTETCPGPGGFFGPPSCKDGVLDRRSTFSEDGKVYAEGDTCPRCGGTGEVTHDLNYPKYMPTFKTKQRLMEEHFEIDGDKIEAERRALLEAIRA